MQDRNSTPEETAQHIRQISALLDNGQYVARFGIIRDVYREDTRATVALKYDTRLKAHPVPISYPFIRDGVGDVIPTASGDEGILLFTGSPIKQIIRERGSLTDPAARQEPDSASQRQSTGLWYETSETPPEQVGTLTDAVFLPARVSYDTDAVQPHAPGERVIAHQSGSGFYMVPGGGIYAAHPSGYMLEISDEADPIPAESALALLPLSPSERYEAVGFDPFTSDESIDPFDPESSAIDRGRVDPYEESLADSSITGADLQNTLADAQRWPPTRTAYSRLRNMNQEGQGEQLAITDGYAVMSGGQPVWGQRGGSGTSTVGLPTDPWRVELESHRHLIEHDDGSKSVTGPPIAHRELFELFLTDRFDELQNSNAGGVQEARALIDAYHRWLEAQTGRTLPVAIPRDANGDPVKPTGQESEWPVREYVPTPEEREGFR